MVEIAVLAVEEVRLDRLAERFASGLRAPSSSRHDDTADGIDSIGKSTPDLPPG
ncbi:hypothetical protein ABZV91_20195 [Nocardia sp. NPDC004568]|uniref:hypothetical protein n=1 Tax=Nocardia sp. NPDC004568 TaxID=3154551 RepID=UPI0033B21EAF